MKKLTFGSVAEVVKEYVMMTVGILFYTFAWIACVFPAGGTGGGATGLSLVLCAAIENLFGFQIEIGTMAFIINGILLLASGFIIGWNFGIKTIFCVVLLSVSLNFFEAEIPVFKEWLIERGMIGPDSISIFGNLDSILLVVMGGLLSGVGIYVCLRQGGSTGGVDIIALLINKFHPINYGRVVMVHDTVVILASLLVGNGPEMVIYGFLLTIVFSATTEALLSGNQQSNQLLIISREHDRIAEEITQNAHRGVTMLDGMGWYTKEHSQVVMVLCRKGETQDILKIVKNIDPKAFISVASVTGVYGQGFGLIDGGMLNGTKKN